MSKIHTSYFAQLKKIHHPVVSICGKAPDWYTGSQFKILAPKYDFFAAYKAGELDEYGYTKEYNKRVLRPLNAQDIWDTIIDRFGNNATLLCYEKPEDFCHRHLVAAWFEKELGEVVKEVEFDVQTTTQKGLWSK